LLGADTAPPVPVAALPERIDAMAAKLRAAGSGPYIGLTWRAGQRIESFLFKDVPIDLLGRALANAGGTLLSVQRAPEAGEHAALEAAIGRPVADFSAHNNDLEDMLALMHLLDDYVGVSNTNMHLRSGTGRRARVLVVNPGEYRWVASGKTSPWFPGFELYRQAPDKSWGAALARLTDDLGA
jgi:hypothetical protein